MEESAPANANSRASQPSAQGDTTSFDQFIQQLVQGGPHGDHPDGGDSSVAADNEEDEVLNFYKDMLYSGIIQLAQKLATQHGACEALIAFWKNSMGAYHDNGKVGV